MSFMIIKSTLEKLYMLFGYKFKKSITAGNTKTYKYIIIKNDQEQQFNEKPNGNHFY